MRNSAVIFDIKRGRELREEAISAVRKHAHEQWKKDAFTAVIAVALKHDEFTTDRVWKKLAEDCPDSYTHEPRAMGAIMRDAGKEEICIRTNRVEDSARVSCHLRPLAVWRSLIR